MAVEVTAGRVSILEGALILAVDVAEISRIGKDVGTLQIERETMVDSIVALMAERILGNDLLRQARHRHQAHQTYESYGKRLQPTAYSPGQAEDKAAALSQLALALANNPSVGLQGLLSVRERGILELVSSGKASKQIADLLNISTNTVNNHRQSILHKLHCHNTAEAVVVAGKLGILSSK